jgi:hypothetical protein
LTKQGSVDRRTDVALKADQIAAFKKSAEGANYVSQGQAPVLQGASPLAHIPLMIWSAVGAA